MVQDTDNSQITDVFTCSNGLKLKLKPISRMLVQEAQTRVPMPKPPIVLIESKGREEENPNDPDYRRQVMEALYKRGNVAMSIALATGTEVIEMPPDLEPCEGTEWVQVVEDVGIEVSPVGSRGINSRYVQWLKYYAITNEDEIAQIYQLCMRTTFTLEGDVKEMVDSFRG